MSANTIKDATRQLQAHFTADKCPPSLPQECRQILLSFIQEHGAHFTKEEVSQANAELKAFWEKYVRDRPSSLGAFAGVLRQLHSAITGPSAVLEWVELVVEPILLRNFYTDQVIDDVTEFLDEAFTYNSEHSREEADRKIYLQRVSHRLMNIYMSLSAQPMDNTSSLSSGLDSTAQRLEKILVMYGRSHPKELFEELSQITQSASSRSPAFVLLGSFLSTHTSRTHNILQTPLLDEILRCLLNDTSTLILSMAMKVLFMILPHIAGFLGVYLPKLFLIYTRFLCWERFNPRSTDIEKMLVRDSRISYEDDDDSEHQTDGLGTDPSWDICRLREDLEEPDLPEVLPYFTLLYGMYPLSLTSYIRKPRRYLKDAKYPGAENFDLDQAVVRNRSDQFRALHVLHPNFCNFSIEDELDDPKWIDAEPADVIIDCQSLCLNITPHISKDSIASVHREPTDALYLSRLPPPSSIKPFDLGHLSSSPSHSSLRSETSRREMQPPALTKLIGEMEISRSSASQSQPLDETTSINSLRPSSKASAPSALPSFVFDELISPTSQPAELFPEKVHSDQIQTTLANLNRQISLLRSELSFEKWHKAQFSQHIGQMMRKNVKAATNEAETLNLLQQNHNLKAQLDQARKAREATIKESALTRKQAINLEANLIQRFNTMKAEQEVWIQDFDELRKLRDDVAQYRQLLVASESLEMESRHQLKIKQKELETAEQWKTQLHEAQRQLRTFEHREFEYERMRRENEILLGGTNPASLEGPERPANPLEPWRTSISR